LLATIKAPPAVIPPASDTVILTHMHPDHSSGLADRNTGQRYFPNAELVMHDRERRALVRTIPPWRKGPTGEAGTFVRPGASR